MLVFGVLVSLFFSASIADQSNWDFLIFTQHWPITVCAEWEESKQNNKCTLPPKNNLWTVHGIWPTKIGTEGPFFCNRTWHFNPSALEPILPDLELYWVNVEANTPLYSFWKHEWDKHGTCAATLPVFDSELSFFRKGLEWVQKYGMANILAESKIEPSEHGYTVQDMYDAIKASLNKNPIIECVIDKHSKMSLISEIRICFDKNLTLVDCDLVKGNFRNLHENVLTNCDLKKSIMYYDKVPGPAIRRYHKHEFEYLKRLHRMYNFLQYLIWFTI